MKIFAQHGYGDGEKIIKGLSNNYIQGAIFSPRDILPDKLEQKLNELSTQFHDAEFLIDPQYYTCLIGNHPNLNIGKLSDYQSLYFNFENRSKLEIEKNISEIIRRSLLYQNNLPVNEIISPNILISNSFDSREAVISKNFIRLSKSISNELKIEKPIISSLVVSSDCIRNHQELIEFLNDITVFENPPDGFYVLVSTRNSESRSELYNSETLSAWMLINYGLKINGFKVINGYSDIFSPLISTVGSDVCSTGWWSNLHNFSLERFTPSNTGGRLPIQRYFSNGLLNRITFYELEALKEQVPEILNNFETDDIYSNGEPDRANEVLQSWEALSKLCNSISSPNISLNLEELNNKINNALNLYSRISQILLLHPKSNSDHLEPFSLAISRFKQLSEV